jgi:hypothetical protein
MNTQITRSRTGKKRRKTTEEDAGEIAMNWARADKMGKGVRRGRRQ